LIRFDLLNNILHARMEKIGLPDIMARFEAERGGAWPY
jgi:hypothetical protein